MTDILTSLSSVLPLAVLIAFPIVLVRLLDTGGAPSSSSSARVWDFDAVEVAEPDRPAAPVRSADHRTRPAGRADHAPARLNA